MCPRSQLLSGRGGLSARGHTWPPTGHECAWGPVGSGLGRRWHGDSRPDRWLQEPIEVKWYLKLNLRNLPTKSRLGASLVEVGLRGWGGGDKGGRAEPPLLTFSHTSLCLASGLELLRLKTREASSTGSEVGRPGVQIRDESVFHAMRPEQPQKSGKGWPWAVSRGWQLGHGLNKLWLRVNGVLLLWNNHQVTTKNILSCRFLLIWIYKMKRERPPAWVTAVCPQQHGASAHSRCSTATC